MSTTAKPERTLTFTNFWAWLQEHSNCILAAGWAGAALFDHDDFHWSFLEEEDKQMVLQLVKGKTLVGELVFDARAINEVEVQPDPEGADRGQYLAEFLSPPSAGREALGYIVLSHGVDQAKGHQEFRH